MKFCVVVVVFLCCGILGCVNSKADTEQKTAQLMEQVLTAISSSSKGADASAFEKLCDMVNAVEASILQMQSEEAADYEFGMARLRAELIVARSNLTSAITQLNATSLDIKRHVQNTQLYPRNLEDARERTDALEKQREILRRECESDLSGQRLRVDAVKADISTLDQALQHLDTLSQTSTPVQEVALLEVETSVADPDCISLPDSAAPMIRCENGYVVTVDGKNGTLTTASPGNGMNYHNNLRCWFRIAPSSAGPLDRIELTFHALNTNPEVDFVRVYDGAVADPAQLLLSTSGAPAVPPGPIRSQVSNEMLVTFIMNSRVPSQGFLASFRTIQIPRAHNSALNMCPQSNGDTLILTGDSGFIAEDSRPEFASSLQKGAGTVYSSPVVCRWLIQAQPEQSIRLHFTFLHTSNDAEKLVIYDGSFAQAPEIARVSGEAIPADIVSSGSALFLTFSSDYTIERSGFHLSWCVSGSTCPTSPTPEPLPSAGPIPVSPVAVYNGSAPAVGLPQPAAGSSSLPAAASSGSQSTTSSQGSNQDSVLGSSQGSSQDSSSSSSQTQTSSQGSSTSLDSSASSTSSSSSASSSSSSSSSSTTSVGSTSVVPPDYPTPATSQPSVNCCPQECSNQGVCNPTTCTCACYTSYTSGDCSQLIPSPVLALNSLLDLDSGAGSEEGVMAQATHQVEDECGDDVNEVESGQDVRPLNLDPIRGLLDRLKFELFRSLTYEKDTTNMTKLQCNDDLRNQDRDIQRLQQEVLNLTRLVTEAESVQKQLTDKEAALRVQVTTTQEFVDELNQRISNRQKARDSRVAAQSQESKTLQSMRDIISNLGSYQCTPQGGQVITKFVKKDGVECFGEVLPIQLTTTLPVECEPLCGPGCAAYSWNSKDGCRFYSEVTRHSSSCATTDTSCACFEKA